MEGIQLPKGTVVTETIERKIVIGGDDSSKSVPVQNLSNPPPYSDNSVGNTKEAPVGCAYHKSINYQFPSFKLCRCSHTA